MVTIAVVDMIMSLVLDHENKKLILRPLNLVHEVAFNENGKALLYSYINMTINDLSKWPCFIHYCGIS